MLSRRSVIASAALAPLACWHSAGAQSAVAETAADIKRWIEENKGEGYFDPPQPTEDQKGTLILAPDDDRVQRAAARLASVPTNLPPLRAAKWMIDRMDTNDLMEWPPDSEGVRRPANPVVIAFFAKTKTKPVQGDQTAWCAAFANWMLNHCGLSGTNSAGAVSFRDYGSQTDAPKPGDIACFVRTTDARFGHVGFFDGWVTEGQVMRLCGGNQKNRLMVSQFRVEGGGLKLHSFRTAQGLRVEGV